MIKCTERQLNLVNKEWGDFRDYLIKSAYHINMQIELRNMDEMTYMKTLKTCLINQLEETEKQIWNILNKPDKLPT